MEVIQWIAAHLELSICTIQSIEAMLWFTTQGKSSFCCVPSELQSTVLWLYAHSKYTRYLSAVVYRSYTMASQFAQLADSGLRCIYYMQAVPLIFTLVTVQMVVTQPVT